MSFLKRKRSVFLRLIVLVMIIVLFSGCTRNGIESAYFNSQFAKSGMKTISKEPYDYDNGAIFESIGLGVGWTPVIKEFLSRFEAIELKNGIKFGYKHDKLLESQNDVVAEESIENLSAPTPEDMIYYGAIFYIRNDDKNEQSLMSEYKMRFSITEPFADNGEYTFYYAYNDDISAYSDFTLSAEDKVNLEKLSKDVPSIPNYSCLFPPAAISAGIDDFSVNTLDGGTFNQDDLAKYDLTMVNVWTTWCPYCIEEMPDLAKLYKDLPANVNLVSICADANEELELAKDIVNQEKIPFKALVPDDKMKKSILKNITAYPTTIFLDSEGNVVGQPQVGAPKSKNGIAAGYLEVIKERLKLITK